MGSLFEAKYDICRNHRLDNILDSKYGRDIMKADLFEYFYEAMKRADLAYEDIPMIADFNDEVAALEDVLEEQLGVIANLEKTVSRLRGRLFQRQLELKEGH